MAKKKHNNGKNSKRTRSPQELWAINNYYKNKAKSNNGTSNKTKVDKLKANEKAVSSTNKNNNNKSSFKLPLKNGGHRWNIYRVSNVILNGRNDGDVHGGLVLDEENGNIMLAQVTHSDRKGKRNNLKIRNVDSTDVDKDGILNDSYIERRLIVSTKTKNGEEGIDIIALNKQMNDLEFTEDEKQKILDELSHLSTAEERYKKFLELAKKKGDT